MHDGEMAFDDSHFKEMACFNVYLKERLYGIQVSKMIWHTIEVYEPSVILCKGWSICGVIKIILYNL